MPNKPLGFAIIGTGTIARVHAAALRDIPNAQLWIGSSRNRTNAEAFARDFDCQATDNLQKVLANPEVNTVIITTSSGSHAQLAIDAMSAGKHVVVEKPMAMSTEQARAMIQASTRYNKHLSVIFQRRYEPLNQAAKQAIDSGALGRILFADVMCPFFRSQAYYDSAAWRGSRTEDGGALMNQAIHSVDLLLWLCGPATRIYAETATQLHKMEAEDLAAAVVHLECGAKATLTASTNITPGFPATLGIYGEHGSIRFSGSEVVHWSVPGIAAPVTATPASMGVATNVLASHEFHQTQLQQIVDATLNGKTPPITGAEGFPAVALVQAAYASAATLVPVNIERL
jgi:UDP-N-acetyl-2-amino-2-deoxyglucuronate dehydrogenase